MNRNFDYPFYHDGRMARGTLWQIEQDAHHLRHILQDEDDLPGWVNYKIATSADRLQAATRYMSHKVAASEGRANPESEEEEEGSGFAWNLSAKETAGVVAVGVGLGFIANKISNSQKSDQAHQMAMLFGGVALYTLGVVVGTNRPAGGWLAEEE
jgi:F0F1-type ATP synthase assembly protein I